MEIILKKKIRATTNFNELKDRDLYIIATKGDAVGSVASKLANFDLSSATSPYLVFDNVTRYAGPQLELYISSNYDGVSNPDVQGTWFNLTNYVPNWDTDNFDPYE